MNNIHLISKVALGAALSHIRPSIKHTILHVTKRCNMRCKHCFIDFSSKDDELTLQDFKSIAEKLSNLIWLDIGGGEPLMREDLKEIVSLFRFEELSIPTNGWLTDQIVQRLALIHPVAGDKLVVTLSLEGMKETHDAIRQPGSFDRTVQTYRALQKSVPGIRMKFNTVLSEKNYDEVVELMHFVKELQPTFHSILMLRGTPNDPSMSLPSNEKILALEDNIYRIQQSYDYGRTGILATIQRNYQAYKRELNLRTFNEKRQAIQCLGGSSHLVIWSNGDVAPCELLPSLGNVRQSGLDSVLRSQQMKKAVSNIKKQHCYCTHDCNMIENILFNPNSYMKLLNG